MRKALALFVLLSMFSQAAMAGRVALLDHAETLSPEPLSHMALHWEKQTHHHHDDESFHQDDSDQSIQHILADGWLNAASLPARDLSHGLAGVPSAAHDLNPGPAPPVPFLEGLKRPPRLPT